VNSPPPTPADAVYCPRRRGHSRKKIKKNILFLFLFLVVVAGLKREKKNFGFRFSIPKIPKIPKLPRLPEQLCWNIRKLKFQYSIIKFQEAWKFRDGIY
jgi:hypothetical protein